MATVREKTMNVYGATLSRRQFVKAGGALVVGISLVGPEVLKSGAQTAVLKNTLDPTLISSWIEIHPDNTVLIRTGKNDFGQGTTFTAYKQIVAEELRMPFEAITTVVAGDTDRTPDGSGAFDFLGHGRRTSGRRRRTRTRRCWMSPPSDSVWRRINSLRKTGFCRA